MWSLEAALEDTEDPEEMTASRELRLHDRSTAVGQVKLLRAQAGIICGLRREWVPSICYVCTEGGRVAQMMYCLKADRRNELQYTFWPTQSMYCKSEKGKWQMRT